MTSKTIHYISEMKAYRYLLIGTVFWGITGFGLVIFVITKWNELELFPKMIIPIWVFTELLLVYLAYRSFVSYNQEQKEYRTLIIEGQKAKGVVVDTKVVQETQRSREVSGSEVYEYFAKVQYYDSYENATKQIWSPELTDEPDKGSSCWVYYNHRGDFYINFSKN